MTPEAYPVFLNLDRQPCLIVGGGRVGFRKARGLFAAGAAVTVISPAFDPEFATLPGVMQIAKPYDAADADRAHFRLIFAATSDPAVNARVAADADARRIWCCRCDDADEQGGQFSGAAIAHIGPITLAVSTAGASAHLAKEVRDVAVAAIDPAWGELAARMAAWRPRILAEVADAAARRRILITLASPAMLPALSAGNAETVFDVLLRSALHSGEVK